MRITVPLLDRSNPRVAELLDTAGRALTMAEAANYHRLARKASEKGA